MSYRVKHLKIKNIYINLLNILYLYIIKIIFILNIYFSLAVPCFGQNTAETTIDKLVIRNGFALLGQPYVAGTLEVDGPESLTCYRNQFDCVTFVEYVLAESLSQAQPKNSCSKSLEDFLTEIRYYNGIIQGYGSRLHYFSQWINQLSCLGYAEDMTQSMGGIRYKKTINFMTNNRNKYPRLNDSETYIMIRQAEKEINSMAFYYIPKNSVKIISSKIKDGDIIAITTKTKGLDIVHTGFALWRQNNLHLLHASSDEGKVIISKDSLYEYLLKHPNQSGIMVVRPIIKER